MPETSYPQAEAYNKIGFHIGPGFDIERLQYWVQDLDNAGVPIFLKVVDEYSYLTRVLDWTHLSNVSHTLLYQMSVEGVAGMEKTPPFNFNEPDYSLPPEDAAQKYWEMIISYLPADFDKSRVWLEILHNTAVPDASQETADAAEWLGEFAFEISHLAVTDTYRIALFGWASGHPPSSYWNATGMRRFLSFCQRYPDQLAVSFHEFSNDVRAMLNTPDSNVGHFRELFSACQRQGVNPPTVFISEWGWTRENVPDPEMALAHMEEAAALYARYPEVQGAALWHLGDGYRNIARKASMLIDSLIDFTLQQRFPIEEEDEESDAENGETTPAAAEVAAAEPVASEAPTAVQADPTVLDEMIQQQTAVSPAEPTILPFEQTAVSPSLTQQQPPANLFTKATPLPETPETETAVPPVWFYMGQGSDESQMSYLEDAQRVIWGANRHTRQGDIVLMYRTSPYQDIAYLFRAHGDAADAAATDLTPGWKWKYIIELGDKITLFHPVARATLAGHPRLQEWSLARTPQGAMSRTEDIRAEGRWAALRGLLLAWNPDVAETLAAWENVEATQLLQEALVIAREISDSDQRREALLAFIEGVAGETTGRFQSLLTPLRNDPDRQVRKAARLALGEQPPTLEDVLQEAQTRLAQQQYREALAILEEESDWRSGDNARRATAHAIMAQAHEALGEQEAAWKQWQEAAALDPQNSDAFAGIGRTAPADHLDEAQKIIDDLSSRAGDTPAPHVGRAAVAQRRDDLPAAVDHLRTAATHARDDSERQQIETLIERTVEYVPYFVPAAEAAAVAERELDPFVREQLQRLREALETHFNLSEIKRLCDDLGINYENLAGETLWEKARSLVNYVERRGRIEELAELIHLYRPFLSRETIGDIIAAARRKLDSGHPQDALDILQAKQTAWQGGNPRQRAAAHALMAQAHEALQQPQQAYVHWKRKAALLPDEVDAFEGIGRTVPDSKLDEAQQFIQEIQDSHDEAVGPPVGLAAIAGRRGDSQQAADLLDSAPAASLVRQKQLQNEAQRLRHDGGTPLATLRHLASDSGSIAANRLNLTLDDLEETGNALDQDDRLYVLQAFEEQILRLPTLSPIHKRDLQARIARGVAEIRQTGRLSPQMIADLHLPVLDYLFITRPAHRRALIRAVATYRRDPRRRLWLYLRSLARARIRALLAKENVEETMQAAEALQKERYQVLETAVWQRGSFVFQEGEAPPADYYPQSWRQAHAGGIFTVSGNLSDDVPQNVLAGLAQRTGEVWRALYNLLYNKEGTYAHLDSWERLRRAPLNDLVATIVLHAFYPEQHLPFHKESAVAALVNLDLEAKIQELDYRTYIDFAQNLLRDAELGLNSLDDVGIFLQQIATGTLPFDAGALEEDGPLMPPLATKATLKPAAIDTVLMLPEGTFPQLCTALNAGNHVILIGPPGTGKTTVAQDIARLAHDAECSRGFISATATADWTTFDTVGGYMPAADNRLHFSEGIILRAIREQKWLIIDEINRADIDKAFGELFTVLSGQAVTLPYRTGYHPIRILPPGYSRQTPNDYVIPPTWRIIGTMNVYDKASLFEMSYAFMRRFAFVDVGIPDAGIFEDLIDLFLGRTTLAQEEMAPLAQVLKEEIFAEKGDIMVNRPLGPAIAQDMIRYVAQRPSEAEQASLAHLAEAFLLYAVPQFDGLEEAKIKAIFAYLTQVFTAAPQTAKAIRQRLRELFPHYAAAFPSEEAIAAVQAQAANENEEDE